MAGKPASTPGRSRKCTPRLIKQICGIIREGNYRAVAATCAGVKPTTFYDWIRKAKRDLERLEAGEETVHDPRFRKLLDAMDLAEAETEREGVELYRRMVKKDASELRRFLTLRFRERWRDELTVTQGGAPWQVQFTPVSQGGDDEPGKGSPDDDRDSGDPGDDN